MRPSGSFKYPTTLLKSYSLNSSYRSLRSHFLSKTSSLSSQCIPLNEISGRRLMTEENNTIIERNNSLVSSVNDLRSKLNYLDSNIDGSHKKSLTSGNIDTKNKQLEDQLKKMNSENTLLLRKFSTTENKLNQARQTKMNLEKEITDITTKINELENESNYLRVENQKSKDRNKKELEKLNSYYNMIDREIEEKTRKEANLKELIAKNEKVKKDYVDIAKQKENLKKLIKKKQSRTNNTNIFLERVKSLDGQTIERDKEIENLQNHCKELKNAIKKTSGNIVELITRKNKSECKVKEYNTIKRKNEESIETLKKLEEEIESKDKTIKNLKQQYEDLNYHLTTKEESQNSPKDIKAKFEDLKIKNNELQSQIVKKKQENEDMKEENEMLLNDEKEKLAKLQNKYDIMLSQSSDDKNEVISLKTENQRIKNTNYLASSLIQRYQENKDIKNCELSDFDGLITKIDTSLRRLPSNSQIVYKKPIRKKFSVSMLNYQLFQYYNNKLIVYDSNNQRFEILENVEGLEQLNANVISNNYENSVISVNTLKGLFLVCGEENNILFYYSQNTNKVSEILTLSENHKYGAIMMDDVSNALLVLSGAYTDVVEKLSFSSKTLGELPRLSQPRGFSSYCFIGTKLYAFFGYNFQAREYIETIEGIDLKSPTKWETYRIKDEDKWDLKFTKHLCINYSNNKVILLGGQRGVDNSMNYSLYKIDCEKFEIVDTNIKIPRNENNEEYFFEKNNNYNIIINENQKGNNSQFFAIALDDENNIHFLNNEMFYEVLFFQ